MTAAESIPPRSPQDRVGRLPAPVRVRSAEPRPDAGVATRCSVRPAPKRESSFDDEPRRRHLHLIQAAATPQLPFPQASARPVPTPISTPIQALHPRRPDPARRLTAVPDLTEPLPLAEPASTPAPPLAVPPATAGCPASPVPASAPMSGHRPDPSRFSRQFAQGVVEVLSGRRPMVQLTRHVSPAVQRGLSRAGGSQPLQSLNAPTLHSLHLSEPALGVCELSAIVVVGVRYRALAARLEWTIDHWRCTALQIG